MNVSPAKHSFGKCDRKVWQMDGQTTDKVIPMCRYASQATQKYVSITFSATPINLQNKFYGENIDEYFEKK